MRKNPYSEISVIATEGTSSGAQSVLETEHILVHGAVHVDIISAVHVEIEIGPNTEKLSCLVMFNRSRNFSTFIALKLDMIIVMIRYYIAVQHPCCSSRC